MKKNLKILIAGGAVLLFFALGVGAYFLFFRKPPVPPQAGGERGEIVISPSPTAARPLGGLINVTESEWVISPALDQEGLRVRYFDRLTNQVKTARFDTKQVASLSTLKFERVSRLFWAKTKNQAILEYTDTTGKQAFTFADFEKASVKALREGIREVAWAPDDANIAYHLVDNAQQINALFVAAPDGTRATNVLSLQARNVTISWPEKNTLLIVEKPAPGVPGTFWGFNLSTRIIREVLPPDYGLAALASPNGKLFLVFQAEDNRIGLGIFDITGKFVGGVPLDTLLEKCAWTSDNETIYCAVPEEIPENASLPFDFWQGKVGFRDRFMKYNYRTGQAEELKVPAGADVGALLIPKQENFLIFLNRTDNSLYSIKL